MTSMVAGTAIIPVTAIATRMFKMLSLPMKYGLLMEKKTTSPISTTSRPVSSGTDLVWRTGVATATAGAAVVAAVVVGSMVSALSGRCDAGSWGSVIG